MAAGAPRRPLLALCLARASVAAAHLAASAQLAAAGARGGHALGAGLHVAAVPEFRVDAALNPGVAAESVLHRGRQRSGDDNEWPAGFPAVVHKRSRCPKLKYTDWLRLVPGNVSLAGQRGAWEVQPSGIALGGWRQNFLAATWADVEFYDLDGRFAARAVALTDAELDARYGWQALGSSAARGNISDLQDQWATATYHATLATENDKDDPSIARVLQSDAPSTRWRSVALLDCEGGLQFVVQLQEASEPFPGSIDVYDSEGSLVARSLTDTRVARHVFVDPQGFLLATAEAPRLNGSTAFARLPKDPDAGGVSAYEVLFEAGGYENASTLLDMEGRWVLAAAAQLRAISDGRAAFPPRVPQALPVACWAAAALLTAAAVVACICASRLAHAPGKPNDRSALLHWKP